MSSRIFLAAVMALLLNACAGIRTSVPWPDGLPAQDYFIESWQVDPADRQLQPLDNYLTWVTRFYKGYKLAPGWNTLTKQVLARVPEDQRDAVGARLAALGRQIGAEWAKNNKVRKINTRAAAVWRDALLEALSEHDLPAYLTRVEHDVDDLLAGRLGGKQIVFERYYTDEFDD